MSDDAGSSAPPAGQARAQGQRRAAQQLRVAADQLQDLSARGGPAADVAQQAATRIRSAASWIEQPREPGELMQEVGELARRRPGMVLAGAAVTLLAIRRRPGLVLAGAVAAGLAAGRRTSRPASRPGQPQAPAGVIPPPPDPAWTPMPEHPEVPSAPTGSAPYYPVSGVPGPGAAGPAGPDPHTPDPHAPHPSGQEPSGAQPSGQEPGAFQPRDQEEQP